ncbi:MAG: SulP family inorganic anion transporter [Candidatus Gracilibacteria bacterium]|nr:SulP family inorganic anion transporter [Candidatus Gracilibacteria bacterium]
MINKLKTNWKAGLTVAMINIPLSISLAVASGATPMQGIITGIWAGIIASLFASSHYNVFGVAGALSSILLGFVMLHPENGVLLLPLIAIFAGFFILLVYIFKLTKYITLIPSTALHGFLISVGVTIALGQLSGALGLNDPALKIEQHHEIAMNIYELFKNISSTNITSFVTFGLGLSFLIFCKKYFPKFPAVIVLTIIGIIIGILVSKGMLPNMLLLVTKFPSLSFSLVDFSFFTSIKIDSFSTFIDIIKSLFTISLVVAIIAIIETIISARIAEKITKVKFNKDREVLGLAISNIGTGLVGGLPNTAVFVRTALNINSGANHRTAAFLIAIFTLIISALLFNGAFKFLPFPIISAILMNIAIGLIDIGLLKKLYSIEKQAFFITLITTFFSVFWEPTYGILIGTAITLIIYIGKITNSDAYVTVFRKGGDREKISLSKYTHSQHHEDVLLTKFSLGLNYLNIETNIALIEKLNHNQKLIISLAHMGNIDIDGIEAIDEMIGVLKNNKIDVYISGIDDIESSFITKIHNYEYLKENEKIYNTSSEILKKLT